MICTCDNCHYTFEADALPGHCPDCCKEKINRRVGTKIIESAAVREATLQECGWYEDIRREAAVAEHRKATFNNFDGSGMTDDEYNWAMVMLFEWLNSPKPKTEEARNMTMFFFRQTFSDPEKLLEYYLHIRREFNRDITNDRNRLKSEGRREPFAGVTRMSDDGEFELIENIDDYGPALSVLYRFRLDEIHSFLHTPNIGDLRKIDLKKIAKEPSAAYSQFLWSLLDE